MPENDALRPQRFISATIGSIATNSSSYFPIAGPMAYAGEVFKAYFVNGTAASATSGTTTASSASVIIYKNASSAGSIIATFNGSGTSVATLGSAVLVTSGTTGTTNGRLAAGDILIGEVDGGAANNASNAGAFIAVDIVYGYVDGATPAAGTAPA